MVKTREHSHSMTTNLPSAGSPEQGFTLIEVLVAVVILSIGILGLISLESATLQSNQSAYYRSQANILVYDMADKMRSNRAADYEDFSGADQGGCTDVSSACDYKQMAKQDIYDWEDKLQNTLPLGSGAVSSVSSSVKRVTVSWDDNRNGQIDNDGSESFSVEFDLGGG